MKSAVLCLIVSIPCLAIVGCGGPKDVTPPPETLHGGVLIALPEDQGFVELLNGKAAPATSGKPEFPLIAYLLQPDKKSPIVAPPKEIAVKYEFQGTPTVVPLLLDPDATDPAGSARFTSKPTSLEVNRGEAAGVIELNLNGKAVSINFRGKQ